MITDEHLEQLRRDAMRARNTPLATRCGQALRGDQAARTAVEEALAGRTRPTFFITISEDRLNTLAAYMQQAGIYAPASACDGEITVAFYATPDQVRDLTGLGFTVEGGA